MNKAFVRGASAARIVADFANFTRGRGIAFEPEGGSSADDGEDDAAKAEAEKAAEEEVARKAAEEKAKKEEEKTKGLSENEAKLLKESMKRKEQIEALQAKLKEFDGIDPTEFKKLIDEKKAAEKAKKEADKKAAEAAGDFDRVKALMAEEHKSQMEAVTSKLEELQKAISDRDATINNLTIGTKFSGSNFISENLVLTPSKARIVYGSYFEHKDGDVVAYDKPAGAPERTMLVDASGKPLSFESAIEKIVNGDPDRDHILKSKLAPGAKSKPSDTTQTTKKTEGLSGMSLIAAALSKKTAEKK